MYHQQLLCGREGERTYPAGAQVRIIGERRGIRCRAACKELSVGVDANCRQLVT